MKLPSQRIGHNRTYALPNNQVHHDAVSQRPARRRYGGGAEAILRALDDRVFEGTDTTTIPAVEDDGGEVARIFEVNRRLSEEVSSTIASGSFPIVLSGNCNCCLGTVAGMRSPRAAAVWFDAHTDFHTIGAAVPSSDGN